MLYLYQVINAAIVMTGIFRLHGTVKHYDWGGTSLIPVLLNQPASQPFAEYWLGTHPADRCVIEFPDGSRRLLRELLQEDPDLLGAQTHQRFGELPYLLKLLDVREMLSIQVHPDKATAERGFARENQAGIPLHAAHRNYRDPNHKPELMVALGEFWLLHGFKPEDELRVMLKAVPEFRELLPRFESGGYADLYRHVMQMPQEEVNALLQPLVERVSREYREERLQPGQESYWAARAAKVFCTPERMDRGIFSIYFFNLLRLQEGEGIYQPAGVPHAYLEGQNVEIMASSDNVLRGGLTSKHVDVDELLRLVKCEPESAQVLRGKEVGSEMIYPAPASEFLLSMIKLEAGALFRFPPRSAEILLLVKGQVEVRAGVTKLALRNGEPAAICFPGETVELSALGDSLICRASVPGN